MILPLRCGHHPLRRLVAHLERRGEVDGDGGVPAAGDRNSSTSPSGQMPALLTRMSTEPSCSTQASTTRCGAPGSVMSTCIERVADALGLDQLRRDAVVVEQAGDEDVGAALRERERERPARARCCRPSRWRASPRGRRSPA